MDHKIAILKINLLDKFTNTFVNVCNYIAYTHTHTVNQFGQFFSFCNRWLKKNLLNVIPFSYDSCQIEEKVLLRIKVHTKKNLIVSKCPYMYFPGIKSCAVSL